MKIVIEGSQKAVTKASKIASSFGCTVKTLAEGVVVPEKLGDVLDEEVKDELKLSEASDSLDSSDDLVDVPKKKKVKK